MRSKNSISALFAIFNIILAIVIAVAGTVFYAGYLFSNSDSSVISAFGYSFHVANENDVQPSVKERTFITAKDIPIKELKSGDLVTVLTVDGKEITAKYYSPQINLPQKPYLFAKQGSNETISLNELQIRKVSRHLYHSDIIGEIFYTFSVNRTVFLISEALLMLILLTSLIIVITRREKIKLPKLSKKNKTQPSYNLNNLITVEKNVSFEKSRNKDNL